VLTSEGLLIRFFLTTRDPRPRTRLYARSTLFFPFATIFKKLPLSPQSLTGPHPLPRRTRMLKLKAMSKPKPPVSPKRLAANRANAAGSTGPRTPEGKARSAQNARKYTFNSEYFAIVRLESPEIIANLRDDAVAFYQPVNSQELFAVERIALAQLSLLRCAVWEAGLFTTCLDDAMESPGNPFILRNPELTDGIEVTRGQNHAYWLAFGINRMMGKTNNNNWTVFLRHQAQAERLHRRAIEEFERLKSLRGKLPNEPIVEPEPQVTEPVSSPEPIPPAPADASPEAPPSPTVGSNPRGPKAISRVPRAHSRPETLISPRPGAARPDATHVPTSHAAPWRPRPDAPRLDTSHALRPTP
jgi:hypothetical protein